MPISKIIFTYLLTLVVFLGIDMVWLGIVAKNLYKKYLGSFLTPDVNWGAALFFYALFVIGILIFAVFPGIEKQSLVRTVVLGALFGLFTYATYDLTNFATLKGWPLTIVVIDIFWGMVLTATVALAGFYIAKWLLA